MRHNARFQISDYIDFILLECLNFSSSPCTLFIRKSKDYIISISTRAPITNGICLHWILMWVQSTNTIIYLTQFLMFILPFFRLTSKKIIWATICQLEKCHYHRCISWCHFYSSYPDYSGYFYWRKARKLRCSPSALNHSSNTFICSTQPHRFPYPLYYGRISLFEVPITSIPFD